MMRVMEHLVNERDEAWLSIKMEHFSGQTKA